MAAELRRLTTTRSGRSPGRRDAERDDATPGILIAAHRDEDVARYSPRGTNRPLAATTSQALPASRARCRPARRTWPG